MIKLRLIARRIERGLAGCILTRWKFVVVTTLIMMFQLLCAVFWWPSPASLVNMFGAGMSFTVVIYHWTIVRPLFSVKYQNIRTARALAAMQSAFEVFRADMEARGVTVFQDQGSVFVDGSDIPIGTTKH
jgi:uncharacterized sodium:solute symporter family permease YidK